jgi:hypothetical protein
MTRRTPDCAHAREHLLARADHPPSAAAAAHLGSCPDCAAFARRREALRSALRATQSEHLPDADFAARVLQSLPSNTELLGWAALRLLPAALALLLGLTLFGLHQTPPPTALLADPSSGLLLTYTALAPSEAP